MAVKELIFPSIQAPCCWDGTYDAQEPCICTHDEKVLRAYADRIPHLQPMTHFQRNWCLDEIGSVEGYERAEYESIPDHELARTVLNAWTDYCRDKGLL